MPRGDRTGPRGQGPMTGRAAGYCAGYNTPGYTNPGWGRGYGRGRGFGRGFGRGLGRGFGRGFGYYGYDVQPPAPYYPAYNPGVMPVYQEPTPEEEKAYLDNLVKDMEKELADIKTRIKELAKKEK